jgi:type IV conjugative transfer system protein TraL
MSATFAMLKHLDAPVRFLSFTMGELISYLAPFFVGAMVDSLFVVPAAGIFAVAGGRKYLKRFPKYFGIRYLYWSVPTKSFNKILRVNLPPSNHRLWIK